MDWFNGLVSGLTSGIKGLLGIGSPSKVYADIGSSMTQGVVKGVKKGLEIASPSRTFMELGKKIPEGLALGVQRGLKVATKAASRMVDEISPQLEVGNLSAPAFRRLEDDSNAGVTNVVNNFNLTMPTSNSPSDVQTAFELMEAWV